MTNAVVNSYSKDHLDIIRETVCLFTSDGVTLKPYHILLVEGVALNFDVVIYSVNRHVQHINLAKQRVNVNVDMEGSRQEIQKFKKLILLSQANLFSDRHEYMSLIHRKSKKHTVDSLLDYFSLGWVASIHEAFKKQSAFEVETEGDAPELPNKEFLKAAGAYSLTKKHATAVCHGYESGKAFLNHNKVFIASCTSGSGVV